MFEVVGAILEEAHGAEEARAVAQNTTVHAAVIEDLLNGAEPTSADSRHLLSLCGMRPARVITVALVRPLAADSNHVDAEVARRSFARFIQQVLPSAVFGKLVGMRNGDVVVIANSDAETATRLITYLGTGGIGKGQVSDACVGVGLDKSDMAQLPDALLEARIALEMTNQARTKMRFSEINLTEALTHHPDRALFRLVPSWLRESEKSGRDRDLIVTIRAFAACNLSVKATAGRLRVHTNTVYFRLNQVKKLTGVDPRTFAGLSLLINALRMLDVEGHRLGAVASGL